jgi:alkylation response protein AidB-like acyl-CoA dehydrogenase
MNSILSFEITDILDRLQTMTKSIDEDGVYPEHILKDLGKAGAFACTGLSQSETNVKNLKLIEEVGTFCNTTSFSVWCHTTAIRYVRYGQSDFLKQTILPLLESGEIQGATGLSNPMKFYAGMELIRLKARKTPEGYRITGTLPFVSNLGPDHVFGIIAEVESSHRIMALVPCHADNLTLIERKDFLGLNGCRTFHCRFDEVLIPPEWVLTEYADELVKHLRTEFILSQTGMALGLIKAAVDDMRRVEQRQGEVNRYLPIQPDDIEQKLIPLRDRVYHLAETPDHSDAYLKDVLRVRLDGAYLALEAANAGMLHCGSAGYVRRSHASRRLREAYFIALVTPAIKQLEKILKDM